MTAARSWWRTNRWWLVALPLTLALMLAAQSYRVENFWWLADFHRSVAEGDQGELVRVRDEGTDALGDFTREYAVRLVGVSEVDDWEPDFSSEVQEVPSDARVVEVALEFEADPDQLLSGCRLTLVGDDGVRYGGELSDPLAQFNPCVPEGRPGPQNALFVDQEERVVEGKPRPPEWSITWDAIVPEDAVITAVRVSFDPPDYVELRTPAS